MPRCAYYLTCLVLVGARTRADLDLALSEWQRTGSAGPNTWQVAGISNLSGLFRGLSDFNEDISGWDTSAALDMSYMFYGCASFDQPLNSWNTSSVRDMSFMFAGASRFNQPIGSWNTSSVSRMQGMFSGAQRFNQELNGWETQAVVNMSHMFYEATSFDQALGKWNTSKVVDMKYMFFDAHEFKQPLSTWDFRAVDAPFLDRKFSAMNPCLLWSAANAHSLPEDLRKLWSLMRCPSCPAGSCSKGQACVAGQCRPVNSGFIELGLGAWPSQLPVAVQGFKACAEACSGVKCVGFLLEESGRCGLITQLERGGEGRTAAFLRATCDTFSCPYGSQRRASDEEPSAFNCCACNGQTVPDLEQYPLLHCLECPEDMVPVEDLCEECAFPFMHLNKTCTLWYWPIILMLLLLLAGVALRMGRWRRQKRQKEAQKLWEAMEQELWEGACDVRRYTMPLARCGWSKAAVWQRLLELKAEQSRCAGVSLLYVLTDFTSLARARLAEQDASFQALLEAFFRGKDPIGRHLRCPRDGRQGCALVDWLEPWHRRPSTHYASYADGMRLSELQAALESWKRGVEEEVFLCMHFFVQNHFRAPNLELSGLGCGHMVVVLNTWHRPSYLHRAWCLYELYSATSLSIPVSYALPLGMQQSLEAELAQGDQGLQRVTSELRGPFEVEVDEGVEKLWAEVSHEGVKNEVQRAIGLWISRLLQQKFQRLLGQVSDCVNI